jgi:hypothetical protein
MAAGLAVFFLTVAFHRTSLRAWLLMGGVAIIVGAVFLGWTVYTGRCLALAEFPLVDLRMSNPDMRFWYFGDLHYRLSPMNWLKGGWRILNACFGSIALAGLFIASLAFLRQNVFGKLWLIGAFLTTLIFTHLILHHWHYFLMFTPAVALITAQAALAWEKHLAFESRWKSLLGMGVVVLILSLSIVQGMAGMKVYLINDPYRLGMVKLIQQHSTESDKLLIEGGGWGGDELFLAHRLGLSIWNTKLLEKPETLQRLKTLGYNKLVMIAQSPLMATAHAGVPGDKGLLRESYRQYMTPAVENWPVIYQDENILIKEIP